MINGMGDKASAKATMKEAGEFLRVLGFALEDNRITREELASIVKEGRDIFAAWR